MNAVKSKINIGTSGWHYLHWKGPYYPDDLSPLKFLEYYMEDFSTVEINNTFYKLPKASTLKNWKKAVPKNFVFSVKMSRYITHTKKLKDPKTPLRKFFSRIKHLKGNLGIILIQLPPHWSLNFERLNSFVKALPKGYRFAFEFRQESWLCDEVFALLKKHGHAFCIYEFDRMKTDKIITAKFVYIRLHGPKGAYQGKYSSRALSTWAKDIKRWRRQGKEIFCYFDNDEKGYAPQNALTLIKKVRQS